MMTEAQIKELLGSLMITLRATELRLAEALARIAELEKPIELKKQADA